MAVSEFQAESRSRCPDCHGPLAAVYESLVCHDCGYTPRHAAD